MEMIQAILATGVILVGLVILGLTMQVIHQVRIAKILTRVATLEARILARLLMEEQTRMEMTQEGTPVTLEDLIQRDLMEQMGMDRDLMTPATEEELLQILRETLVDPKETMATETMMTVMTPPTPERDMADPMATQTTPTKTVHRVTAKATRKITE